MTPLTTLRNLTMTLLTGVFIFTADLLMPWQVAAGVLYAFFVLSGWRLPWRKSVFFLAVAGSFLAVLGLWLPGGTIEYSDWTNLGIGFVAIWSTALVVYQRRFTELRLDETSQHIRVMIEHLPIIPYTCKAFGDFTLLYIDKNIKVFTGYDQKDLMTSPSFWRDRIHPDDRERVLSTFFNIFEQGFHEREYRWKVADGSYRWFVDRLRLVHTADKEFSHIVGVFMDITERKVMEMELSELSKIDALTGLANRRFFDEFYNLEWRRMAREKKPLSLLMIDVDFFKDYNDNLGHMAGDRCLQAVAETLAKQTRRPGDLAARYGGDEFVIVLSDTDQDGAICVAEEIRIKVEMLTGDELPAARSGNVTVSIGVATVFPEVALESDRLIRQADEALYQAKRDGRNRVRNGVPSTSPC